MSKGPREVIIKSMIVDKSPDDVFQFCANPINWEKGGALKNIREGEDGLWLVDSPFGPSKIKLHLNKEFGIFDHDYSGGGGEWTVYCRVMPNERGSTVSFIFIRPKL